MRRKERELLKNNKMMRTTAIVGSLFIVTIGGLLFNQMHNTHQENTRIIANCFDNFDQGEGIVIKKDGFWSPVSCEKNEFNES